MADKLKAEAGWGHVKETLDHVEKYNLFRKNSTTSCQSK